MESLEALARKSQDLIKNIARRDLPESSDSESDRLAGKIVAAFEEKQSFETFAGFPRDYINHLVDIMAPFALNARKRGPPPKSSLADALLCYLTMLRVPADGPVLAKTLDLKEAQFSKNIDRARRILNAALKTKWPEMAPRPLDDDKRKVFEAGLLIDTITTECFKPKGRFGESKHYFDNHHKVYGLKSEVAVTSARPHVMVALSRHYPASNSDYEIHKQNFEQYLEYLRRSPDERRECMNHGDDFPFWAAICDKMYTGPATDTPNERRLVPLKGHGRTQAQKKRNKELSVERTPVECYFGRLVQRFPLFATVYRFDHSNFDIDFENACLLTNEDITISNLTDEDGDFFHKFLDARVEKFNVKEKKRKAETQKHTEIRDADWKK